jgi:hypothetical protein
MEFLGNSFINYTVIHNYTSQQHNGRDLSRWGLYVCHPTNPNPERKFDCCICLKSCSIWRVSCRHWFDDSAELTSRPTCNYTINEPNFLLISSSVSYAQNTLWAVSDSLLNLWVKILKIGRSSMVFYIAYPLLLRSPNRASLLPVVLIHKIGWYIRGSLTSIYLSWSIHYSRNVTADFL